LADAGMKSDSLRSIVLIGGGSHLGGLAQKMEETMKIKVRLGQYPSSLNIINHDIHRIEYIEVLSLLAKAAEDIAPDETCLTLNNYDNTGFEIKTNSLGTASPEQPENKTTAGGDNGPRRKKKGRFGSLIERLSNLMTEDEEDDDNDKRH